MLRNNGERRVVGSRARVAIEPMRRQAMINRMFGLGRASRLSIALLAVAAATLVVAQPAVAAASNACVSVRIDAPFRLPDGTVYPAGGLTLCDTRSYSPIAESHVVYVDGSAVGQFRSWRRATELTEAGAPEVVFEREPGGTLALVGYIVPVGSGSIAFRLKGEGESWQASRRARIGGGSPAPVAAIIAATGAR
jgi:hypothetical protein